MIAPPEVSTASPPACMGSFDARDWARDFVAIVKENPTIPTDEETMTGWFANAIMAGYDHAITRPVSSCCGQPTENNP